jgi:hypothetical protein
MPLRCAADSPYLSKGNNEMSDNRKPLHNTIVFMALLILVIGGAIVSVILPRFDFTTLRRFTLEGTSMSVLLPSKPSKTATSLDSVGGKLATVEYNTGAGTLLFTVNYTDIPEGMIQSTGSNQSYYDNALERIVTATKAEVLDKRAIQYGAYAGEEVLLKTSSNIGICTRFLLVKNRFIQLTATTTWDNVRNKKVGEFMASFLTGE